MHDVRPAGSVMVVKFHLFVSRRMVAEDAHAICDRIEGAFRKGLGSAVINIHVEPERKARHTGVVVL